MPLTRGQRLRRLRDQKDVDLREAGRSIGVSAPYLSLLERDRKGKHLDHVRGTLERAASYYEVLVEYLLVDDPRDYTRAWVDKVDEPAGVDGRLRLLLTELQRRWGDDFSIESVAESLGTTVDNLDGYFAGQLEITPTIADQLSKVTGAPAEWLVPRPTAANERSPAIQRVVDMAIANGLEPDELEGLIQVWLSARSRKPSGG